ncbi:hypothetical protein ACGFNU_48930 [Spirillospora sp. NPDC048911]|uniref:hypothetical protein n=1 Tax=Spirillospora sp. NPDC048911 TaxID=3364527 RepID=UPI00370F8C40
MRSDPATLVIEMARREAAAALLAAPLVEFGARGPAVRVRQVPCPVCGAVAHRRRWTPPLAAEEAAVTKEAAAGPVLRVLACETLTARAVLPILVMAERSPELRSAEFETRALTWLEATSGAGDAATALAAVNRAERWVTGPAGTSGRTLPASTRRYVLDAAWPTHRERLVPSFLSPHPAVSPALEELYVEEFRASIVHRYELAGA